MRNNLLNRPTQLWNCDESGISSHVATREKTHEVKGRNKVPTKGNSGRYMYRANHSLS